MASGHMGIREMGKILEEKQRLGERPFLSYYSFAPKSVAFPIVL